MNLIRNMRLFVRVAELGSFKKGGAEVGISPAAATKSIAILEAHLGVALICRTTRTMALTVCGSRYLEHSRNWLEQFDALERAMQVGGEPRGKLRVASTLGEQMSEVSILLHGFKKAYPAIDVEFLPLDQVADPLTLQVDVALVRGLSAAQASCIVHIAFDDPLICVAAVSYLRQHGVPHQPHDLHTHFYVALKSQADVSWLFQPVAGQREIQALRHSYLANTRKDALTAAIGGLGYTFLEKANVKKDLEDRRLVHVLSDYVARNGNEIISVIVPDKEAISSAVKAFTKYAHEYAQRPNGIASETSPKQRLQTA